MHATKSIIWIAWVLIASFFVFALAASAAIPFSNTPVSFGTVLRSTTFPSIVAQLMRPWHVIALLFSVVPVVFHTCLRSPQLRFWIPLGCLVSLLLWFTVPQIIFAARYQMVSFLPGMVLKSFAQWFIAAPAAPFVTALALAGRQDGEFYEEGMLAYAGFGWWMLLCFVLLLRGWLMRRRAMKAA